MLITVHNFMNWNLCIKSQYMKNQGTMERRGLMRKRRKDAGSVKATREGQKRTWHYQSFRRLLIITPGNPIATCVCATLKSALLICTEIYLYSQIVGII